MGSSTKVSALKNSPVSYLIVGLCLQSPAWVQSLAQGVRSVQTSFSTGHLLGSAAEAGRQGGVLPYPRSNSR